MMVHNTYAVLDPRTIPIVIRIPIGHQWFNEQIGLDQLLYALLAARKGLKPENAVTNDCELSCKHTLKLISDNADALNKYKPALPPGLKSVLHGIDDSVRRYIGIAMLLNKFRLPRKYSGKQCTTAFLTENVHVEPTTVIYGSGHDLVKLHLTGDFSSQWEELSSINAALLFMFRSAYTAACREIALNPASCNSSLGTVKLRGAICEPPTHIDTLSKARMHAGYLVRTLYDYVHAVTGVPEDRGGLGAGHLEKVGRVMVLLSGLRRAYYPLVQLRNTYHDELFIDDGAAFDLRRVGPETEHAVSAYDALSEESYMFDPGAAGLAAVKLKNVCVP